MDELHEKYVFVSTYKANNNIYVVCKFFYIETMLKELGIQDPDFVKILPDRARCAKTYIRSSRSLDTIVKEHNLHLRNTLPLLPLMQGLPVLM